MRYLIKTYYGTVSSWKETDSLSVALSQIFDEKQIHNFTDEQLIYFSNFGVDCTDVDDGDMSGSLLAVKGNKTNGCSARSYWYKNNGKMNKETKRGIGTPASKSTTFDKDIAISRIRNIKLQQLL